MAKDQKPVKHRRPLKRSFLIGITVFILLMCTALSLAQYARYRKMLYKQHKASMANILAYVAGDIDVDDLAACMRTGEPSEQYDALQQELDHLRDRMDIHAIYVVAPLNAGPSDNMQYVVAGASEYEYTFMADQPARLNQLSGNTYPPETAQLYLDAYNSGELSFFESVSDRGDAYTGLMPLFDSKGAPVAALCVEVSAASIRRTLMLEMTDLVGIILLLGAVFAVTLYRWTAHNVTDPIEALESSVSVFADACDGQRNPSSLRIHVPPIHTANEVGSLTEEVRKMSEAMQTYAKNVSLTENERARMAVLANKDSLTEVRNKNAFKIFAAELQTRMSNGYTRFVILMMDLNRLKRINDTYGHEKGDIYITRFCDTICTLFCHSPVFRMGGDEFVVVLQGIDYQEREALLEKAEQTFARMAADQTLEPWERCSVAIGMSECDGSPGQTVEQMLKDADEMMYQRKEAMHRLDPLNDGR